MTFAVADGPLVDDVISDQNKEPNLAGMLDHCMYRKRESGGEKKAEPFGSAFP
jgi:hypothetical protein